MANNTTSYIYFLPRDREKFEPELENVIMNATFPGLMSGSCDGDPDDYIKTRPEGCGWFGFSGSHAGAYPAYLLCCPTGADVYRHPCDEDGNIALPGNNAFLQPVVLTIPIGTMQFLVVWRECIANMLDAAAADIESRIEEIEAQHDQEIKNGESGQNSSPE